MKRYKLIVSGIIEFDEDGSDEDIEELLLGIRVEEAPFTQIDIACQELQETAKDVKIEMKEIL